MRLAASSGQSIVFAKSRQSRPPTRLSSDMFGGAAPDAAGSPPGRL
jgi:hypothetical protein